MADAAPPDEATWEAALKALEMNGVSLLDWIRIDVGNLGQTQQADAELQSRRLQMAMDRMSKFIATLSDLMKKMSDTSSSIIENLK